MAGHLETWVAMFAAAAVGCGCGFDTSGSSTSLSGETTTSSGATVGSGSSTEAQESTGGVTSGSTDTSSSGEPMGDPEYPTPEPLGPNGACPLGYLGPITFDSSGWLCLPPCTGDPPTCPQPQTGDAEAQCATNPMSTADPCVDDSDCEVDGEFCGNIGNNERGCLLPPSHCILRCNEGQTCPDEMSCSPGAGICQYLP
jgi:hypothetical protein